MDTNYEAFCANAVGMTNEQVHDEIFKKMREYGDLIESEIPPSVQAYKEKLRLLFEQLSRKKPNELFEPILKSASVR